MAWIYKPEGIRIATLVIKLEDVRFEMPHCDYLPEASRSNCQWLTVSEIIEEKAEDM